MIIYIGHSRHAVIFIFGAIFFFSNAEILKIKDKGYLCVLFRINIHFSLLIMSVDYFSYFLYTNYKHIVCKNFT